MYYEVFELPVDVRGVGSDVIKSAVHCMQIHYLCIGAIWWVHAQHQRLCRLQGTHRRLAYSEVY